MQHEDYLDDFNEKELNQEVVTCVEGSIEGSIEGREKSLPPTKESYERGTKRRGFTIAYFFEEAEEE